MFVRNVEAPMLIRGGCLPHAGAVDVWELPAPVCRAGVTAERLWLRRSHTAAPEWLERTAELPYPGESRRRAESDVVFLGTTGSRSRFAEHVLDIIGSHGELMHHLHQTADREPDVLSEPTAHWFLFRPFANVLREHSQESLKNPPLSTIVRVQQRVESVLAEVVQRLRRVLFRRRRLRPVAIAESLDAACVQWLARQPGRNLQERAGSKQQVLAVVREDSVDTFENRVLKALLTLISIQASRYVRAYQEHFPTHDRVKNMKRFATLASDWLGLEEMNSISSLVDDSRPNYALQFEARYREVWWAYQQLIGLDRQEHSLWQWRHRIWAEFIFLDLIRNFADKVVLDVRTPDVELGILRDPQGGHWIHPASCVPVFQIEHKSRQLRVELSAPMHSAQAATTLLGPAPVDVVVMVSPAESERWNFELKLSCLTSPLESAAAERSDISHWIVCPDNNTSPAELIDPFADNRDQIVQWPAWGEPRAEQGRRLREWILNQGIREN